MSDSHTPDGSAEPPPETPESLVGQVLGAYRVEALLGTGGMGEVYRGVHMQLGRPVAIKALKPAAAADKDTVRRFFDEARAVNDIRHENIVECTDLVNEPGGRVYIVMELLEGRTLGEDIRDHGKVAPMRAVRIAAQIANAIGAAHAKGHVHRDLKPDNVFLIARMGSPDYVKILDFGIARLAPRLGNITKTETGVVMGTPAYMSPEQAQGLEVDASTDIYTLGVILFHMLTGRLPFQGPSLPEVLIGHMSDPVPDIVELSREVPQALADVVVAAMAKKPEDRPATMSELRTLLLTSVGIDPGESILFRQPRPKAGPGGLPPGSVVDRDAWGGSTMDASGDHEAPKLVVNTGDMDPNDPGAWSDATMDAGQLGVGVGSDAAVMTPPRTDASVTDSGASGTRDLRAPKVVPPKPGITEIEEAYREADERKPRLRYAAIGLGALALVCVAVTGVLLSQRGGESESSAGAGTDVRALPDASGPSAAELRRELDEAIAALDEPPAPPACRTTDPELVEVLIEAVAGLDGGAPGSARPADVAAIQRLADAAALSAAPGSAELWHWTAKARLYAGQPVQQVVEAALQATTLCEEYAAARAVVGTALFRAGRPADAEPHYAKAIELAPDYRAARFNLALVQQQNANLEDAILNLDEVIARDDRYPNAHLARGQAYLVSRVYERAIIDLERAVKLAPDDATALRVLGIAYEKAGRGEDAQRALCQSAELGDETAAQMCNPP